MLSCSPDWYRGESALQIWRYRFNGKDEDQKMASSLGTVSRWPRRCTQTILHQYRSLVGMAGLIMWCMKCWRIIFGFSLADYSKQRRTSVVPQASGCQSPFRRANRLLSRDKGHYVSGTPCLDQTEGSILVRQAEIGAFNKA